LARAKRNEMACRMTLEHGEGEYDELNRPGFAGGSLV
jgi:hypothetical protein